MKRKRLTASIIALVMSVSLPMTTYAANWYLEDGSVTVNADNSGQTVTQGSGSAVPDEAPVITQRNSSAETSNTITINASENATANVTISNVNIDTSGAAVSTGGKGNVNIELDGTNTLKSGRYHAGLEKSQDGKLTITDENANGKLIATGDATLKVQGGLTDEWDGAGAGIGNGGRHNGDTGSFIPVNGAETEPDTSNLTTGKIEYYAPGADMTKDEPTSTTFGSLVQPEPSSPGETGAPVEYRMQTSASEPVQGNGKSTGYKAPVQGHFYQVVGQDGKDMIFATAQKKDVLAIATDSDFAMLTGKMVDIEALRKQGVRRIIFATKRATSTFLLSELLEKRAYGETWSLIHDGGNVAFTAVEKMMDISSILTRLQTK